MSTDETRTTCPYCGVGCGVVARAAADGSVAVRGDPDHPANLGRLCSKGSALGETFGMEGRLFHPQISSGQAEWDTALDLVASRFRETIDAHGPDAVAFYVSGQLLTEDYYVANKLIKGFIGSGNIDTNSRLCMASSVAGHKRAFGEDVVPGTYEDFDEADLIVLVGSNAAWCHPILHQRMLAARRARGTKIVVIDPRRSATADDCDLHLAITPGSDVLLFNGLLVHLARSRSVDDAYIAAHVAGYEDALASARADAGSLDKVAAGCGLDVGDLRAFYDLFAATTRTVTVYSQGVNQSSSGTDKVNSIINCHLATGRIGWPGRGPFSVTGQPNAMGGREVGGLANQLAAHMGFENPEDVERVRRFWNAPAIATKPGLKAVDMFRAVGEGRIKALWIMGTNPAVSMPDGASVRAALKSCAFVAVSDIAETDTTVFADVLLPAAGWGEKDGTVTNSERRISRQRRFRSLPGEVRPDWRIICDVAARMGYGEAFRYTSPAEIWREHAALSAFENGGERAFDLGALEQVSDEEYDRFSPRLWPSRKAVSANVERLFANARFPTPDGKACCVSVRHRLPARATSPAFPLALNTGRLRDQWHTMTRTGRVARLCANAPSPIIDISVADASQVGLAEGDLARISNAEGTVRALVHVTPHQPVGQAFLPMHWSARFAAEARAGTIASSATDPVSGQPELKHTPIQITREEVRWEAFLITRRDFRPTGFLHWSRQAVHGGWLYALMGSEPALQGALLARSLLSAASSQRLLDYTDRQASTYRAASVGEDGCLGEALLVAPFRHLPSSEWLVGLLVRGKPLTMPERIGLLAARSPEAMPTTGRVVCSCMNIGINQILAAAAAGASSVEAIGKALGAGTNCGSCRSEIRTLLHEDRLQAAE